MQTQADNANKAIARVLADGHVIFMKALNFDWNMEGPRFSALHAMFEDQCTGIAEAMDESAERIRILGAVAPGTSAPSAGRADVREIEGAPSTVAKARETVADHAIIHRSIAETIAVAQAHGNDITVRMRADRSRSNRNGPG